MPNPLRAAMALLLLAAGPAALSGCSEDAAEAELFLNLSASESTVNVAERDAQDQTPRVTLTASAPGAADGDTVAFSISDFAQIIDRGAGAPLGDGPASFAFAIVTNGSAAVGARCTGNIGVATVRAFLLDSRGQPVGDATTTFECYLDDKSRYQVGLKLKDTIAPVGGCVDAEVRGYKDNGLAAEGHAVSLGCTGCMFNGQTAEDIANLGAGELNKKSYFLDPDGIARAELCCMEIGRVGVRAEWDSSEYGDPSRIPNDSFTCIAEGGEAQVVITADRSSLRVGTDPDESRAQITVTLLGPGGAPQTNSRVNSVQTNNGDLTATEEVTPPPQGSGGRLDTLVTDDRGAVELWLWAGTKPGNATITVVTAIDVEGQDPLVLEKRITIPIIGLGTIDCVPPAEQYLTIGGRGGREKAQICFAVQSTLDEPLPDFPVEFDLPTTVDCPGDPAACGTAWIAPTRGHTDANGMACTFLHAGRIALPVAVRATGLLHGSKIVSDCPAMPIVGGRTSARGLGLRCDERNVGAFLDTDGLSSLLNHQIACHLMLKDRFGNPVPEATNVSFRAEAGTITHSVSTRGRPEGQGSQGESADSARATAIFDTFGQLPKDVEPLPRDPSQGRERAEPSYQDGSGRVRNPRDGLVTIIAYTVGEEDFTDLDGDGSYDPGEPFIDLAEPWVDYNDNGVRDLDEPFIDVALPEQDDGRSDCPEGVTRRSRVGIHDSPNGCWDSAGIIWTQTRILYSGAPYQDGTQQTTGFLNYGLQEDRPRFRLQKLDVQRFKFRVVDENLNLLNPSFSVDLLTRGAVQRVMDLSGPTTLPDSWGMGFSLAKVCNEVSGVCAVTPRIDSFAEWADEEGSGYDWHFTLASNAPIDGPCCAPRPPPESLDIPELLPQDRDDERCQPPEGFVFPGDVPEDEDDAGPGEGEGEGEEAPPEPPAAWSPGLFEDTLVRVTVAYGATAGAGPTWSWQDEVAGWSCGNIVVDAGGEEELEVPTSCLRGVVLGPQDRPIEGAVVTIMNPSEGFDPEPATTDAEGGYCLVSSLGRHNIEAEFEGDDGFRCRSQRSSVEFLAGAEGCDEDCRSAGELVCTPIEGGGGDGGDGGEGDDGGEAGNGEGGAGGEPGDPGGEGEGEGPG